MGFTFNANDRLTVANATACAGVLVSDPGIGETNDFPNLLRRARRGRGKGGWADRLARGDRGVFGRILGRARRGRARLASCGTRNDSQRERRAAVRVPPNVKTVVSRLWIGFISISSLDGNVRRIEWVQYTRDAEPPASKRVCESTANRQNAVGFPGANPPYALKIPTKQADSGRGFFHAPPPCNFQC